MLHQSIQNTIAAMIGKEKVMLEYRFDRRRADIYWPKQKIIFEIQCTPISLVTVRERNQDYEKFGLTVIWILHQKCFNKSFVGPAENYLRSRSAFFTNIFTNHTGMIYDQHEVIHGHRRLHKSSPYPIDISKPEKLNWRQSTKRRLRLDTAYFEGARGYGFSGDRNHASKKERRMQNKIKSLLKPLYKRYSHAQRATTLALYITLKLAHRLRHFLGNGKDIVLKNKSRSGWQKRLRGETFHYTETYGPRWK